MDREKVIELIEFAINVTDSRSETVTIPMSAGKNALALLKEQEQIKEESITPFEVLDIISSFYGGKQIFFQEENGMIYDRYKCEYITLEDAVYRMAKMVGDDGDA